MGQLEDMPLVGVWDQVLAFGEYQHQTVNGTPCVTVHDATTCKVMFDDFAAHPDCDIFYDKQHEVDEELGEDAKDRGKMMDWARGDGHALAWANAMVMIIGSQVARYEAHPGAPEFQPTPDAVLVQSDGTRRGDGAYCLRSVVTPRGADPKEGIMNFRSTSPYYVPMLDGNRLLNLTVTNDPRMRGCALAFSRNSDGQRIAMNRITKEPPAAGLGASAKESMDPKEMKRLMEAAGCKDDDKPEDKFAKMTAHAGKMEAESKKEKEASEMARKKMDDDAAEMARVKQEADKKDEAEKAKKEDEERAKQEAAAGDKGAMQAMSRKLEARDDKIAMLEKGFAELKASLGPLSAIQEKNKKREATELATSAIAMGRCAGNFKGTEEDTVTWLAGKYELGEAVAEDVLSAEGTFKPSEAMAMKRPSRTGAPDPREDSAIGGGTDVDSRMDRAITMESKRVKDAGGTPSYDAALAAIAKKDPTLHTAWLRGRSS